MLGQFIHDSWGAPGDTVSISDKTVSNIRAVGTCFAGIKLDSDNALYIKQANGGYSAVNGEWFVHGNPANFYFSRTIVSGTLTTDAGAGPLQSNVDREYDVQQVTPGTKTATISIDISDDVSGSPILDSAQFVFRAEQGTL